MSTGVRKCPALKLRNFPASLVRAVPPGPPPSVHPVSLWGATLAHTEPPGQKESFQWLRLPDVRDWLRGGQPPQRWANHSPLQPGCFLRPGQSAFLLRIFFFWKSEIPFSLWSCTGSCRRGLKLGRQKGQLPLLSFRYWSLYISFSGLHSFELGLCHLKPKYTFQK